MEVDYQLHELPDVDSIVAKTPETPAHGSSAAAVHTVHDLVRLSLVSRIEILEAENTRLKGCLADREGKRAPFGIEQI